MFGNITSKTTCTLAILAISLTVTAKEPRNLDFYKQELIHYHDSGQYNADITKVTEQAKQYLAQRVADNKQAKKAKKLAIVLDIDETSLSAYSHMRAVNFGFTPTAFNSYIEKANEPAISGTLSLYNYAIKHHVSVFFITMRRPMLANATYTNLFNSGYTLWRHVYFKTKQYPSASAIPYKATTRKKIEKEGYDIVENIGDQYSDLSGGYADKTFKIPNPFYFIA